MLVLQRGGMRGQAVVQPPALRATHRPRAGRVIVEDVDRDDRAVVHRGDQRGVVVKTQVLTKPKDGWFG